jgi:hypothetical protein
MEAFLGMTAVASAHAAAAAAEPKQESIVVTERKKLGNFWGRWGSGRDSEAVGWGWVCGQATGA